MTTSIGSTDRMIRTAWQGALLACTLVAILLAATDAGAATAVYRVTFEAIWSAETHPEDFPGNPHFSGLIGGTHNGAVSFWEVGELASLGIKRMAEWGSQTPLDEEVEAAIAAGNAGSVVSGSPWFGVPGSTELEFSIDEEFGLITLVAMIAPSPDWFVGVSGLALRDGDAWLPEVVVTLWPHDAGTDSGPSYSSPDQPTNPPDPIFLITDGPVGNGVPIGSFTFTLVIVISDVPAAEIYGLRNAPNPFNPATEIRFELPRASHVRLDVYDVAGRRVATLLDEPRAGGAHSVVFSPENLASGTYLALLRADGRRLVRKITLVE